MSIFDELTRLINEAEEKVAKKKIPISPDFETADQGIEKALEKITKYFQKLTTGSGGDSLHKKDDMDVPDDLDWLDPELKSPPKGGKDKEFEQNRLVWDEDKYEDKLNKEIEGDNGDSGDGEEDDEFDDFNYKDNPFGDETDEDEEDDDGSSGGSSGGSSSGSSGGDDDSKSESERLEDAINNAIDKLKDDKQSGQQDGSHGDSQEGSQDGGQDGGQQDGSQDGGSGKMDGGSPQRDKIMTNKDKRLEDLKKSLEKGDKSGFEKAAEDLKNGDDGSGGLAGEQKDISDDDFESDFKDSGFSDKEIKKMKDIKDEHKDSSMSEEELNKLKKEVVDGLEDKCKERGGSALAKTIVKSAAKKQISDDEWKKMLEVFLKGKSVMKGDMSRVKNRYIYGNKNHLWRGAVLPTKTYGHGLIQKIYCFVDFSGSVDQDLVYTFLGKVIDLCQKLNYTDVTVYGFGDNIVLPRTINGKMLKVKGKEVVLSQTWDYIRTQHPGAGSENFEDVANEINEIRHKDRSAVYLIFGDAIWSSYGNPHPPIYVKEKCGERIMDNICVLTYYTSPTKQFAGEIAYLKEICKFKHIITTKAKHIREDE